MVDQTPAISTQSAVASVEQILQALPPELVQNIIGWLALSPTIDTLCASRTLYNQSLPHLHTHPRLDEGNVEAFYGHLFGLSNVEDFEDDYGVIEFYFHRQAVTTYEAELHDYYRLAPLLRKLFCLQHAETLTICDSVALQKTIVSVSHYHSFVNYVRRCVFKTPEIKKRLEAPLFQEVEEIVIYREDIAKDASKDEIKWKTLLSLTSVFPELKDVVLHLPSAIPCEGFYDPMIKELRAGHLQTLTIYGLSPAAREDLEKAIGEELAEAVIFHTI
ncbi:hypothetical protein B9479_003257 [Cryptococcus floricola]|uniref:Uncharacterized protein n=1 Tax=Cryptococcus floricola TaxID=2591691 RepID=A0A5D3AXC5_9TREE|nr:hypothetical protein B9479_003257 [Cryptococcus floricola]